VVLVGTISGVRRSPHWLGNQRSEGCGSTPESVSDVIPRMGRRMVLRPPPQVIAQRLVGGEPHQLTGQVADIARFAKQSILLVLYKSRSCPCDCHHARRGMYS